MTNRYECVRNRGADVGAHDDGNGCRQRQASTSNETDHDGCGGRRALNQGGGDDAREQSDEGIGRQIQQRLGEFLPKKLEGVTEQFDALEE